MFHPKSEKDATKFKKSLNTFSDQQKASNLSLHAYDTMLDPEDKLTHDSYG